jgi:hypothetical protein
VPLTFKVDSVERALETGAGSGVGDCASGDEFARGSAAGDGVLTVPAEEAGGLGLGLAEDAAAAAAIPTGVSSLAVCPLQTHVSQSEAA